MDSIENSELDQEVFTSKIHKDTSWDKLNEYRKTGKYCDLTLNLPNGSKFSVHRIVMVCGSEYFRALLEFDDEKTSEVSDLYDDLSLCKTLTNRQIKLNKKKRTKKLKKLGKNTAIDSNNGQKTSIRNISLDREISEDNFEKIIEFIYTGNIVVTIDCVLTLHENAVFFNLLILKEILTNFMVKRVTISRVLNYWRASMFDTKLQRHCVNFMQKNYEIFFNTYLPDLTFKELKEITAYDELILSESFSEKDIFVKILKWVNFEWIEREKYLKHFLNNICFDLLNDEIIFELVYDTVDKFLESKSNNLKVLRDLFDHIKESK